MLMRACIAKALGTFPLVFSGCGSATLFASSPGAVANLTISAVFELVVQTFFYTFGGVSGDHSILQ